MICQHIWVYQFTLIFGIHLISNITILAVFVACFATGIYLFSRFYGKKMNYFLLIAAINLIIAIYITCSPWLINQLKIIYLKIGNYHSMGPYSVMIVRIIFSFLFFFIPATLMGGSFILIYKLYVRNLSLLGKQTALTIGWFVTGLAAGILAYNFVFISLLGIFNTGLLLTGINIIISLLMLVVYFINRQKSVILPKTGFKEKKHSDEYVFTAIGKWKKRLLRFIFLSSFSTTSFLILWKRILTEFSEDKTTYFRALLFSVFLISLAAGNFLTSPFTDKFRRKFVAIAAIQLITGITSFCALVIFLIVYPVFSELNEPATWLQLITQQTGLFLSVLLIPFGIAGFFIPLSVKVYAEDIKTIGYKTSHVFLLMASGILSACYITSFILIPVLGIYKSYLLFTLFHFGIGIFIFLRYRRIKTYIRAGSFLISVIVFIAFVFFFTEQKFSTLRNTNHKNSVLEKRIEGSTVNIEVHKNNKNHIILYINGEKAVSSDPQEIKGDKLLSYIPYLFNPYAEKALIIGLGIGITAKTMAELNIKDIEIVEISPEVTKVAANAYAYINDNILVHENVSIFIEDGRSYLLRSKAKYDIIICNAAHPRINNALYTEDFFKICSEKLSDNGYLCQWMPLSWISADEFWSIIRSCIHVFPYTTLWYISPGQTLLLASNLKQQFDYCNNSFSLKIMEQPLISNMKTSPGDLLALIIADDKALRAAATEVRISTDNFPALQFSRRLQYAPDTMILKQLAGFQISFNSLLQFGSCTENEAEILTTIEQANFRMKSKLIP